MTLIDPDFVLVWDESIPEANLVEAKNKRRVFEENLEEEGLQLERECLDTCCTLHLIKIRAPLEVITRYSEILKIRLPMKEIEVRPEPMDEANGKTKHNQSRWWQKCTRRSHSQMESLPSINENREPDTSRRATYYATYSRAKNYLFEEDETKCFTSVVRARILYFILQRKRYTETIMRPIACTEEPTDKDDYSFGIERLLAANVYSAAYPLHDGDLDASGSKRSELFKKWAAVKNCFEYQPIDEIKDYFGVQIGLYFAWLGFYTYMLIFAVVLGLTCFLYGCLSLPYDQHSKDICDSSLNITMCPLCDNVCDYWSLHDICFYARLTYLFDNDATVLFAVFMSFWSAVFLECWKRYSAEITHWWDITGYDVQEEHPRPEYLVRVQHLKETRPDRITNAEEPDVPFWKMKLPYRMFSTSMILLLISLALTAVVAVVAYRVALTLALYKYARNEREVHSWGLIVVNTTAACINLVFIFFFNWLYTYVAEYLTELELHRTQTEFDDSLTLKMYMLQFVNNYASICYIAFFKGKFPGCPAKYTKFLWKWRQEECNQGCMTELWNHLAIIMVGKQAINIVLEIIWPFMVKMRKKFICFRSMCEEDNSNQWAKDFKLLQWGSRSLFPEYLEMVLQYGFVTIFVAAFPLAPVFALLKNILEVRLDAQKLCRNYRRPVAQQVKDIGVWHPILDFMGKLAVISNAFIIAFNSNFIPKLMYRWGLHETNDPRYGTLQGFLEHSLTAFNTSELETLPFPEYVKIEVDVCKYSTYRHSYEADKSIRYMRTDYYWKVWMARIIFVVVFENVVSLCVTLLRWWIPDIPMKVRDEIRREKYLTNQIIIKEEISRATGTYAQGDSVAWNPVTVGNKLELVRCSNLNRHTSV